MENGARRLYRRKVVAVVCTIGVAVILVGVMIIEYMGGSVVDTANTAGGRLRAFYTTIVRDGQSFFASK